jgi:hypothetical protein
MAHDERGLGLPHLIGPPASSASPQKESMSVSLFVSVAAYQDVDLWPTLVNAAAMAHRPAALHLSVLEQSQTPSSPPEGLSRTVGRISYLHLDHRYSRGPCWARSMISTYVRDEAYFLQIDSHMRFDAGWDVTLVDALESLNRTSPRSIISTYPCAFELIDNEVVKKPIPGHALVLKPNHGVPMSDQTPVLGFYALPTKSEVILPGHHVGAGCLFSRASLLREVPIDPWLYFHGEEQNLAVRAWTHGWDIWHMPDMPIFHRYHDGGGRPVHWNEADDRQRSERWWELDRQANARMRALLYDRVPLGCYGLGSARSLEDFARASGLDYPARAVR